MTIVHYYQDDGLKEAIITDKDIEFFTEVSYEKQFSEPFFKID